jgi:hypothetical protein
MSALPKTSEVDPAISRSEIFVADCILTEKAIFGYCLRKCEMAAITGSTGTKLASIVI